VVVWAIKISSPSSTSCTVQEVFVRPVTKFCGTAFNSNFLSSVTFKVPTSTDWIIFFSAPISSNVPTLVDNALKSDCFT
jgi:hypothetical protein